MAKIQNPQNQKGETLATEQNVKTSFENLSNSINEIKYFVSNLENDTLPVSINLDLNVNTDLKVSEPSDNQIVSAPAVKNYVDQELNTFIETKTETLPSIYTGDNEVYVNCYGFEYTKLIDNIILDKIEIKFAKNLDGLTEFISPNAPTISSSNIENNICRIKAVKVINGEEIEIGVSNWNINENENSNLYHFHFDKNIFLEADYDYRFYFYSKTEELFPVSIIVNTILVGEETLPKNNVANRYLSERYDYWGAHGNIVLNQTKVLNGLGIKLINSIQEHINNKGIHVTIDDKNNWNIHVNDKIKHFNEGEHDQLFSEGQKLFATSEELTTAVESLDTKVSDINNELKTYNYALTQSIETGTTNATDNTRGFGTLITNDITLGKVITYCHPSNGTENSNIWLKVFEKTSAPHIFKGISDASLNHKHGATLEYTFENNNIKLEANKEYFFVFCSEEQKNNTTFQTANDSIDCCIQTVNNTTGYGGVCGSNGISKSGVIALHKIYKKPGKFAFANDLEEHASDNIIHISEKERTSWNEAKMAWDETKTNFTNNLPEITSDKLNSWGFMIKSPKSGSLKTVTSFCREAGTIAGGETYLKVWNEANECIGCSVNKFAHSLNAVHEYIFENITLEKDSYYKFSYITDEEQKTTSDTNSNVQVCLKSTPLFPKGEVDQIFNGYSLDQSLDRQVLNNTSSVQIIIDINFFNEIEKLEKKISNNEENISAIGLDIDAINETINSITEPKLEILTYVNSDPHDGMISVDEFTLDVYTTDESGVTTPADTLPDINISYQCTDGFIYTSNAVAYSPFINVVLSEENNQAETGENNISEGRPQHTATLKFSGLSGIKEDITRVIIFDAIIAGNSSNGYNNCKHISRIFPVHFRVAPSTSEES